LRIRRQKGGDLVRAQPSYPLVANQFPQHLLLLGAQFRIDNIHRDAGTSPQLVVEKRIWLCRQRPAAHELRCASLLVGRDLPLLGHAAFRAMVIYLSSDQRGDGPDDVAPLLDPRLIKTLVRDVLGLMRGTVIVRKWHLPQNTHRALKIEQG